MTVVELGEPPSIVASFVRSLRPVGRRGNGLSDRELVLSDVRADPVRMAAYQRLCGFPVSSARPATFIHVEAFPLAIALMSDPRFPFPLLGLLHVSNVITQYRVVEFGQALTIRMRAADLREHRAGRQVDLVGEARAGDELVWTGVATYLHRERRANATPSVPNAAEPGVPAARWRLAADLGRRYAAISGDRNPIHLSRMTARAFGFSRPIAHGMYLHARALAAVESRLPAAYRVEAAFKTPAPLPSTVAFESGPTDDRWDLRISAARTGRPHFTACVAPLPS